MSKSSISFPIYILAIFLGLLITVGVLWEHSNSRTLWAHRLKNHEELAKSHSVPSLHEFAPPLITQDSTYGLDDNAGNGHPICPKWESYDLTLQTNKDFSTNCKKLDYLDPGNFTVQLCMSKRFCGQGYFVVSRVDKEQCQRDMKIQVSRTPKFDKYVKDEIGPDTFMLIFDGPERAAPAMWRHLGNCDYKIPFRLTNPGLFTLKLLHTSEKFRPFNELNDDWAIMTLTPLLPPNYTLDVCSSHCEPFTSHNIHTKIHETLPLCSRTDPTQGVFLRMTGETARERLYAKGYNHTYIYEPLGCRFDQLFTLHRNDSCLSKRNNYIRILGDSQTRALWHAMEARLSGTEEPVLKNVKSENYQAWRTKYFNHADLAAYPDVLASVQAGNNGFEGGDPRNSLNGTTLDYEGANHLEWFYSRAEEMEQRMATYDALIVNAGHWQASGYSSGVFGRYTTEGYAKFLDYCATLMIQHRAWTSPIYQKPLDYV
ncbi:hypothetical protein BCR33DRAFT_761825 [Rhizoclosmatium globosum]|uniref:Uncharacterized protein n=1 Tax=Rhizoclosmatium globosum TaxID=329046 RepID=A0A1Y2CXN7_9FUNG|nr:hypothetical protein BCR33DRAFT_761825 [Rhizoclosmatium globosum]|eukprot:ORY51793.1 hypothetical protein BCR33DRAFT_761825 [Rhizoclosmatium globosum]